jgi:hypothetical protein
MTGIVHLTAFWPLGLWNKAKVMNYQIDEGGDYNSFLKGSADPQHSFSAI